MIAINVTWLQRFPASGTSVLNLKYDWPSQTGSVSCSVAECVRAEGLGAGQIPYCRKLGEFFGQVKWQL